jgi:dephospho-CoA kinase
MIIGTAGTFGAGKDEVSKYLEAKGFEHVSTSIILREKVNEAGLEINALNLFETSNKISDEFGNGALAEWAFERIDSNQAVISGLRKAGEIDFLKRQKDFSLFFVDAPIKLRYSRIQSRKREGEETLSLEEFRNKEDLELRGDTGSQNILYCKEKADFILSNTGTIEDLHTKVDDIIRQLEANK